MTIAKSSTTAAPIRQGQSVIRRMSYLCRICAAFVLIVGCGKSVEKASPPNGETKQTTASSDIRRVVQIEADSCGLITPEEVEQIQGTAVQDTKGSRTDGRVQALQCYYVTAEPNRSVSLMVMKDDPAALGQNEARKLWNRMFRRYNEDGDEREEPAEIAELEEEEREHKVPVTKVEGIGEKAFWVGSHAGPSLYVFKRNAYFRVSVGGADSDDIQLARSKKLALKALDRL